QCLQTGMVTNNSPHVRQFEDRLQAFFGSRIKPSINCNIELALYHLIQAWKHKLGNGPHDSFEVLVPSFTFSGTINALAAAHRPLLRSFARAWIVGRHRKLLRARTQ
ncbi:MAG: hypothetical protein FJY37_14750, partial [Betaproteobacteria bacterium]|nr:hypothetical protein [Betaproteobacteria bacterium]